MKARLIVAAIFAPILFIVFFFLPPVVTAILIALISLVASYELLSSILHTKNIRIYIYTAVAAFTIPFGAWRAGGTTMFVAEAFLLMTIMFIEAILSFKAENKVTLAQVCIVIFAGAVMPYFISTLVNLKTMENGRLYILLPIIAAFISDAGAYFSGITLGRHKIAPLISPQKSVEGCVGGIIAGVCGILIFGAIISLTSDLKVNFLLLAVYGFVGSIVTEIGDLAFSLVKREYGVKDFGSLLPGHGGILDRFDSMYFAAPLLYLLIVLFPAF